MNLFGLFKKSSKTTENVIASPPASVPTQPDTTTPTPPSAPTSQTAPAPTQETNDSVATLPENNTPQSPTTS